MYNAGFAGDLVRPYDATMTTFAENLKREIARVARKELKAELDALRKTCTTQRSDIAALKRDVKSLQGRLFRAERVTHKTAAVVLPSVPPPTKPATRSPVGALGSFNHEAFADFRKTLRITQSEMGRLVEASTLSVWKWETGKAQPRAGALLRIQTAMKLGKRAAIAKATTPT
ncbi:MAG: helix-turn-helix domain-containing protein [Hydrogenophaga sp.]|jgi:DNA-binding XRE family transcriptional regulator